ncbi:helix-turn-helix domain-containing protein [Streptomyces sp. DT24]|uniref:helix-turn-helix domain-containing protein n=1 Tax=unclassified Streptomyces TaxID=2593676 RepID=UPI003CF8DADB
MAAQHTGVPSIRGFQRRPHLGAAAHRRALGEYMRRCRGSRNLTGKDVARRIGTSPSTVSRMESGERTDNPVRNVAKLLSACRITDDRELSHALSIAEEGERPEVWAPYADYVAKWVQPLLALEPAARRILSYEPQLVPGWLQTEEYAQLVIRAGFPDAPRHEIEARAKARVGRLHMVGRAQDPPALVVIMDEDVLRRPAGSPGVMYRQIEHLIQVLKGELRHRVKLQIAPLAMGMTGAVGHPIVHLRFADDLLSDFVYLEQSESARCIEGAGEAERYQSRLFRLCGMAVPADRTLTLLEDKLAELARNRY